jgi:GNAT superfamily N-acetyltransferase
MLHTAFLDAVWVDLSLVNGVDNLDIRGSLMQLTFHPFRCDHFPEYAAWFADPVLDRHLGPLDKEWLEAVLDEQEEEGATWAIFRAEEMVAVVGTCFDQECPNHAAITELAVKPALRRHAVGITVLKHLLVLHEQRGIYAHIAFVSIDNLAARRCIERAGFYLHSDNADEHGYLIYLRRSKTDNNEHNPSWPR